MKLEDIRKKYPEYKIPDLDAQPLYTNIIVWRIPESDRTKGGLYVPETSKMPRSKGVLLAAGLKAMDELNSYGTKIGDVVEFAKYAGVDLDVKEREGATPEQILVLKSGDLLLNKNLFQRLQSGELTEACIEGEHFYTEGKGGQRSKRFDPGKVGK